jgi:hypothetical protein
MFLQIRNFQFHVLIFVSVVIALSACGGGLFVFLFVWNVDVCFSSVGGVVALEPTAKFHVGTGEDPFIAEVVLVDSTVPDNSVGPVNAVEPVYENIVIHVPSEGGERFVSIIGEPTE